MKILLLSGVLHADLGLIPGLSLGTVNAAQVCVACSAIVVSVA